MKKLLFFGFVSFLLGAIWFLPLPIAAPYILKNTQGIAFLQPSGTVFNGSVNDLAVNNHYIGKATWSIDLLKSLKNLALTSKFTLKGNDINANGTAGISPNKTLHIENMQFDINAAYLNKLQTNAVVSGNFTGFIKQGTVKQDRSLPMLEGIINWQNGALNSPIALPAGNYRAKLQPNTEGMSATLSSSDAPIELNGTLSIKKNWLFNTDIGLKTKLKSLDGLMIMLRSVGKPQADNSILIKQQGDLKPFIGIP